MKYKLVRNLPTFKAGDVFELKDGNLCLYYTKSPNNHWKKSVIAYHKRTLDRFPSILKDWFEPTKEAKTVWSLKNGDEYWFIDAFATNDNDTVDFAYWMNDEADNFRRDSGNCFLTKQEAQKELRRRQAEVILKRDTNGFKPDWCDREQHKYFVFLDHNTSMLKIGSRIYCQETGINFATELDARKSINEHEGEWLAYFGVNND